MDETLSPTGVILEVLGDLELPIITPIKETGERYENCHLWIRELG